MEFKLKITKEKRENLDENKFSDIPDIDECYTLEVEFEDGSVKYHKNALETLEMAKTFFMKFIDTLEKDKKLPKRTASEAKDKIGTIREDILLGTAIVIAVSAVVGVGTQIYVAKKNGDGKIIYKDKRYVVYSKRIMIDRERGFTLRFGPDRDTSSEEAKLWISFISLEDSNWDFPYQSHIELSLIGPGCPRDLTKNIINKFFSNWHSVWLASHQPGQKDMLGIYTIGPGDKPKDFDFDSSRKGMRAVAVKKGMLGFKFRGLS